MIFLRISQEHPYLLTIQRWYETSFPAKERRNFDALRQLLSCPDMHLCALVYQEQLAGFIIYWQWPDVDMLFIEHFAIDPEQRGKQLGQKALKELLRMESPYFILEVELPENEISRSRVRFYERQGFELAMFDYAQPSYQRENSAIPMRLMSIPAITQQAGFAGFSQLIKERVYERFYH